MKKSLILILPVLFLPTLTSAEELLPAICQQVINPAADKSISQIVTSHIAEKVKTVPQELVQDAQELMDDAVESLASAVESRKPSLAAGVLGASDIYDPTLWETVYDKLLSALAFAIRHWLWSLGGLIILIIGYSFRP